jgi:hypothetical protein
MSTITKKSIECFNQWVINAQTIELRGDEKVLLKAALGKRIKIDGEVYYYGNELVKALRRYVKRESGGWYRYSDWTGILAKELNMPDKLIKKIIRGGPEYLSTMYPIVEEPVPVKISAEKSTGKKKLKKAIKQKLKHIDHKIQAYDEKNNEIRKPCEKMAFEMTERWDVNKTNRLLRVTTNNKAWVIYDVVKNCRISPCGNYYINKVFYKYGKKRQEGRVYADSGSFQGLNKVMRRYMCNSEHAESNKWQLRDIDMENAYPSILYQIAKRHGIDLEYMRYYIENREAVLIETMSAYNINRDLAKKFYLSTMHGGNYTTLLKKEGFDVSKLKEKQGTFIVSFKGDIQKVYDELKDHYEFRELTSEIENDASKTQKRGTFISYLCNRYESQVLETVIEYSMQCNYVPVTRVFDGFMIEWRSTDNHHHSMSDYLNSLNRVVLEKTGLDMVFTNKSLEMEEGDEEVLFHKAAPYSPFGKMTMVYDETNMNKQMTSTGDRFVMHDINDKKRVTCMEAHMGLGKSHTLIKYIENKLRAKPETTIISLSCRRSHSRTQQGGYDQMGFDHYLDGTNSNRLIIQYESLHKLYDNLIEGNLVYDVLILDEAMSILKLMVSVTNKRNLKKSSDCLRLLFQMAKKVILLDADLCYDVSVYEYLMGLYQDGDIEHLRYNVNPLDRYLIYTDEQTFYRKINEDLESNKSIVVCFRSNKKLKRWLNQELSGQYYKNSSGEKCVMRLGDKYNVLRFSSESNESDMEIFKNINQNMSDDRVVLAYTSKVMVGIDLLKKFHRVYVQADGRGGVIPRSLHQMIGRARVLETNEVWVLAPDPEKQKMREQETYQEMFDTKFKSLERLRAKRDTYVGNILDQYQIDIVHQKVKWTPEPVLRMFAHDEIERNQPYFNDFHRIAVWKGYNIRCDFHKTTVRESAAMEFDMDASTFDISVREKKNIVDTYNTVKEYPIDKILIICDNVKNNPEANRVEDRLINRMCFACKLIPHIYYKVDAETIEYIMGNVPKLYLFKAMESLEDDIEFLLKDIKSLSTSPIPELYHLKGPYIMSIDRILKAVGFEGGIRDRETHIGATKLIGALGTYKAELSKLLQYRGFRGRSTKPINTLKHELTVLGLNLVREKIHISGKNYLYRYSIEVDPILESIKDDIYLRYRPDLDEYKRKYTESIILNYKPVKFVGESDDQGDLRSNGIINFESEIDARHSELPKICDIKVMDDIDEYKDINVNEGFKTVGIVPYTIRGSRPYVLLEKRGNKWGCIEGERNDMTTQLYRDVLIRDKFDERFNTMRALNNSDPPVLNSRSQHVIYLRYIKWNSRLDNMDSGREWVDIGKINQNDLLWSLRGGFNYVTTLIKRFSL